VKQVLLRRGAVVVDTVPAPVVAPGNVLVQVRTSCISVGTEISGLKNSGMPLWKLALKYPEHLKKTIETAGTLGIEKTWSVIQGRLQGGTAVGYSAAGVVLDVGSDAGSHRPGDRVACAGAQSAHHAEVISVPANLTTAIPDQVPFDTASTVTLGAIAMQGVRRAQPTMGETFAVVGLGALGQLTAQMLRANGCRVIGLDLDQERIAVAQGLGMDAGVHPDDGSAVEQAARLTDGFGVDGVIITAASSSDAIVSTAFRMCRRKGRVVLVGDVGLNMKRADIYEKELDFFISTSYGPGRYDAAYEEKGVDYPIGYVRWTENRNMQEYLRLIAEQKISVAPLISSTYPVASAPDAYQALQSGTGRPLLVLLTYPEPQPGAAVARVVRNPIAAKAKPGAIGVALVGAGGFAKGMHLPNLQALGKDFHLRTVMSRKGHNAAATAKQWGAEFSTTDFGEVLRDTSVDAVIIATRHNLHAPMALEALSAGKHVMLEKPLAISAGEADQIRDWYAARESAQPPILLTGFNRRFSPHMRRAWQLLQQRSNPMIINYRMNAGYIPLDHWVHSEEGGGRNIGEACHIYDLFTFLTGSEVTGIHATPITPATGHYSPSDNFVATMSFKDGSVATLTYTSMGSRDHVKEEAEIFFDGKVIQLEDYKRLTLVGAKAKGVQTKLPEKGQKEELEALALGIRSGEWPIPLWQQLQATNISFEVERSLRGRV
jgi:predicted dehydrogenase/threonine dehydrogenase-like Zn-dependent dehydrogenase